MFLLVGSAGATTFPVDEAGISAYVHVDQTIDLEQASDAFTTLDIVNETYIIGTVSILNYGYTSTPSVYVSRNGWIVAYFPNSYPASQIVQWYGIGDSTISRTTLEDAINSVATAIGTTVTKSNIKYYDFRYPAATEMMIVAKITGGSGSSVFYQTIPDTFTFYGGSFSHYSHYSDGSVVTVDGVNVDTLGQSGGFLINLKDEPSIINGTPQTITISQNPYGSSTSTAYKAGVAVVLIYSPP
jgi:hypothetical protein